MNTNEPIQRDLFPRLPMPTQESVISVMTPHFPHLWHTIMDPWEEFLQYRSADKNFTELTEDEAGQWLTIQAAHRARQFFDGKPGFRLMPQHGKLVIVMEQKLLITIKKLRKRRVRAGGPEVLVRSNYLTKRNQ